MSYFKEEDDSGVSIILANKVTKTLIEYDLFLPLRDNGFAPLEVERLSHDGENVVDILLLVI